MIKLLVPKKAEVEDIFVLSESTFTSPTAVSLSVSTSTSYHHHHYECNRCTQSIVVVVHKATDYSTVV